jgi:thiol-disulfide isomerase/thioredoxin
MAKEKNLTEKLIQKPIWLIVAVIAVATSIFIIEMQKPSIEPSQQVIDDKNSKYQKAQEFAGIERWINSEPLKINELKGKVVLVDFWTYTCINCIRTLPYLKAWDEKYRDAGLVIVGVHTPEFNFEKKYENVLNSVNDYGIKFPVAMDNNYVTWQLYQNRYWPHKYLVDMDGYIRYDHIGEGNYEETEKMIQELLNERMERMKEKDKINYSITPADPAADFSKINTPEIYFGYEMTRGNLGNIKPQPGTSKYSFGGKVEKNYAYVSGEWKNNEDNLELVSDSGEIILVYDAKRANIVAEATDSRINVMMDNIYLNEETKGFDVVFENNRSVVHVSGSDLYSIANASDYGEHYLSMRVNGKGFRIYTFTFG